MAYQALIKCNMYFLTSFVCLNSDDYNNIVKAYYVSVWFDNSCNITCNEQCKTVYDQNQHNTRLN